MEGMIGFVNSYHNLQKAINAIDLIFLDKYIMHPLQQQLSNLSELSVASGIVKKTGVNQFGPLKLAYYPFRTSQQLYRLVQSVTKVWQQLIYRAASDDKLFQRVFRHVCCDDPVICGLLKLKKQQNKLTETLFYNFIRSDYFIDKTGLPKLIQYNLESVSMSAHAENYQRIKELTDRENSDCYIESKPNQGLIDSIQQLYLAENLSGLFLFIVQNNQTNIIEQRHIQIGLLQRKIRSKMITLQETATQLSVDEQNNLKLGDEIVSVAYYRSGYNNEEYLKNWNNLWAIREKIQLSKAIKIPDATMKLLNSKRMQTELSKEEVYTQYLTKEEADVLKLSVIRQWEFDSVGEEEFQNILNEVQQNPDNYVLKPNCEGGGNNVWGTQIGEILQNAKPKERSMYILMQKIHTNSYENILINGSLFEKAMCDYEVSNYGVIFGKGNQLITNKTVGHLIRVKPTTSLQGGIMAGVGSLCSWMVKKEEN